MSRTIHFADKGVRARTSASEPEVLARLRELVGGENVLVDEERVEPYAGDALKEKFPPEAVVLPQMSAVKLAVLLKRAVSIKDIMQAPVLADLATLLEASSLTGAAVPSAPHAAGVAAEPASMAPVGGPVASNPLPTKGKDF